MDRTDKKEHKVSFRVRNGYTIVAVKFMFRKTSEQFNREKQRARTLCFFLFHILNRRLFDMNNYQNLLNA